jgi:hypothetical protein
MRRLAVALAMTGLSACRPAITAVGGDTDGGAPPPGVDASGHMPPKPDFKPPSTMAGPPCPGGKCSDFPAAPIIDQGAPANAPAMFGGAPSGAGPCLLEPEDGTLFPQKWLRPRVKWTGSTGLHRITIKSAAQDRELVAYTTRSSWAMPKDIWEKLSSHVTDTDIVVTVRAAGGGESSVKFQVAPVSVGGSMVFWAVKPTEVGREPAPGEEYDSELRGFSVGDEATVSVLRARQVKQPGKAEGGQVRPVRCIGCHVATPDEGFVAFMDDWPWNLAVAGVKPDNTGAELTGLSDGGRQALNLNWGGMMAFSKPFWNPGRRLVLLASSLQGYEPWSQGNRAPGRLLWYNLDAVGPILPGMIVGEVAREGDPNGAASPAWSHDGARVVYASTQGGNLDGALFRGATDLYNVPFNDGKGGPAKAVPGASEPAFEEYYPAFSPDDALVAYNRVPSGELMYANRNSELAVIKDGEVKALRLQANDPPRCSGKASPGVNNHWPKWAPSVIGGPNGRKYYFLLFSSNRSDIPPVMRAYPDPTGTGEPLIQVTQLYVSVVVDGGEGGLRSYPALYLWNQPTDTLNMTPIWENLAIPTVIK